MSDSRRSKNRKLPIPADIDDLEIPCLPERKLLCAILQMALVDACGSVVGGVSRERTRDKARKWLLYSDINCKTPFSLGWICDELDLCALKIRNHVRDLIETKTNYVRPTARIYGLRGTGDHVTHKNKAGVS